MADAVFFLREVRPLKVAKRAFKMTVYLVSAVSYESWAPGSIGARILTFGVDDVQCHEDEVVWHRQVLRARR